MRGILIFILAACVSACTTGQCRRDGTPVVADEGAKTISEEKLANEIISISKSDNSLQCGYNVGITLEVMAQELQGMTILKSEKKHDGLMRIQSCGAPTGMMNVYQIYRKDAKKAVKMGFKILDVKA